MAKVEIMKSKIELLKSYQTLRFASLHQTPHGELADFCLTTLVNGRAYEALDLSGLKQKEAVAAMNLFYAYGLDPRIVRQLIIENPADHVLERRIEECSVSNDLL